MTESAIEGPYFEDDSTGQQFEPDAHCLVCGTAWTYGPLSCPDCHPHNETAGKSSRGHTMSTETEELKPCPNHLCGGEAMIIFRDSPKPGILCKKCGIKVWREANLKTIIAEWNTRPLEDSLDEQLVCKLQELGDVLIVLQDTEILKDELVTALEEATDDIEAQARADYPELERPDQRRRYSRDMEQVTTNRALIKRAKGE